MWIIYKLIREIWTWLDTQILRVWIIWNSNSIWYNICINRIWIWAWINPIIVGSNIDYCWVGFKYRLKMMLIICFKIIIVKYVFLIMYKRILSNIKLSIIFCMWTKFNINIIDKKYVNIFTLFYMNEDYLFILY